MPVWPLADYVAVNPFAGFGQDKFLDARSHLRSVSGIELMMPLNYFRKQYQEGKLTRDDINMALDELVADAVEGVERLDINQVLTVLAEPCTDCLGSEAAGREQITASRKLLSLVEYVDRYCNSQWTSVIAEEISKHCSNHYDQGQATWASGSIGRTLFQEWRSVAMIDLNFEMLGISGFRKIVAQLPDKPECAIEYLLCRLQVPESLWPDLLLHEALSLPGWSAWTTHQDQQKLASDRSGGNFAALLAMRLAYQFAVAKDANFSVNWHSVAEHFTACKASPTDLSDDEMLRYVLLKASEIAFRSRLLVGAVDSEKCFASRARYLSQMVFCIDVRSERIRRHLENASQSIQTFGFAGFFGLPIEYVPMGEQQGHACVPVLITPQFKVHEDLDIPNELSQRSAGEKRTIRRFLRKVWLEFKNSAVSCFSFVESIGLWYGLKLIGKSMGFQTESCHRFDGIARNEQQFLGPVLHGLQEQGVDTRMQIDLAESILRGIGLVNDFSRLVVFCGHGSQGENNPLQAALDCGACGGHTGEANARFAAKLFNQGFMREALAQRGISIPADVHFLAAVHNTTTDDLEFFDLHQLPQTHQGDLKDLTALALQASKFTRRERQSSLSSNSTADLLRRSRDWSEVRQEWGLAGNAAFVAAPRDWTRSVQLNGRVFLHSYQCSEDPDLKFLEQIMTAPMIVAHWINMQFYASTVDPTHFGSGSKTIHNVVGNFGILSGNSGDLMTGLPWQSVHDGNRYQHEPLRLLAVIVAPCQAVDAILVKHPSVKSLLINSWMQLVVVQGSTSYRYTERGTWEELVNPSLSKSLQTPQSLRRFTFN